MLIQILGGLLGGISVLFVALICAYVHSPRRRRRRVKVENTFSKWRLPRTGKNLELWKRTKKLLDEIEAECKSAEKDANEVRAELAEVRAERDELQERLNLAERVLREFTHPGMQVRVRKTRTVRVHRPDAALSQVA